MEEKGTQAHPAASWQQDILRSSQEPLLQLRLAAMAGHMRQDKLAARRAALIDLLADGRPHPREEIWISIATQLGEPCWGKRPQEALLRDLNTLRRGGVRIAYSRRPGAVGYYLQHPPLERSAARQYEAINWTHVKQVRRLSLPEKNRMAFAAAKFALQQRRLLLAEEHPDWSAAQAEQEARQLVFDTDNQS